MPGHLEKRSEKSWTIVIDLGRDPLNKNKRKRIYKAFRGTEQEAQKELIRLLAEVDQGTFVEPTKLTFAEYLQHWLDNYARLNVAPKTYLRYEEIIKNNIIPELGAIKLNKLRPLHIQSFPGRDSNPRSTD